MVFQIIQHLKNSTLSTSLSIHFFISYRFSCWMSMNLIYIWRLSGICARDSFTAAHAHCATEALGNPLLPEIQILNQFYADKSYYYTSRASQPIKSPHLRAYKSDIKPSLNKNMSQMPSFLPRINLITF